jgi:protease II
VVVPDDDSAIEDMDLVAGWLVLFLRQAGRQQVAALPLDPRGMPAAVSPLEHGATGAGSALQQQPLQTLQLPAARLPSWALSITAGANADHASHSIRLLLSSPVHPERAFDWDLSSQQLVERHGQPCASAEEHLAPNQPGAIDSDASVYPSGSGPAPAVAAWAEKDYGWQQLTARSADGVAVPLTVACSANLLAGPPTPRPCLLVVYGAYGHCLPTDFMAERAPLLRRGWVLALAHVRGGGELGRRWHAAGRGARKAAGVADLEACLDCLVAKGGCSQLGGGSRVPARMLQPRDAAVLLCMCEGPSAGTPFAGFTSPGLVALQAHSAGGVAAGALLNRRAADVGAALLEAPFLDVLSAMCRPELPLTVAEYEEWGDPRCREEMEQVDAGQVHGWGGGGGAHPTCGAVHCGCMWTRTDLVAHGRCMCLPHLRLAFAADSGSVPLSECPSSQLPADAADLLAA